MGDSEERVEDFLECLGNGKSIYECEDKNDLIDEEIKEGSEVEKDD